MKEFTFNTDSWHFWIANFAGKRVRPWRENDICSYTRAFMMGFAWLTLASVFVLTMVGLSINMVYEFVLFLVYGTALTVFGEIAGTLYFAVTSMLVLLGLVYLIVEEAIPRTSRGIRSLTSKISDNVDTPSFLTLAYTKWKEKTCFKIKFEE